MLSYRYAIAAIIITFLLAGAGFIYTRAPQVDEATFSNAAFLLITKGYLAMPVIESAGTFLQGIDRYMYWNMPGFMVCLAGWFKIFGVSVFAARALSLAWGLVAVCSWALIVRLLSGDRLLALLSLALAGLNYDVLNLATNARTDMMTAALDAAGMAAYLALRERRFTLAVVVSHSLIAAAFLTHPFGLFGFAGLVFLTLYYDMRRIKPGTVALAAIPYVTALCGWGIYIRQNTAVFRAQFFGNVQTRKLEGFAALIVSELKVRYWERYVGWRADAPLELRLKVLVLLAYAIGIAGCASTGEIRKHKGYRALLILTALHFLILTFLDSTKWYTYVIFIVPLYSCVLAVWIAWCYRKRFLPRWIVGLAVAGFLCFQLGSVAWRMRLNSYRTAFLPVCNLLLKNSDGRSPIIGSAEFAFATGFDGRVIDDFRLGYYSHKNPQFIVMSRRYEDWMASFRNTDPAIYEFMRNRLQNEFHLVFEASQANLFYKVYQTAR